MAAGDGFKKVPFGFDMNEVNSYISDLRKKMNAIEAELKQNGDKIRAAEQLAAEADDKIKAAVKSVEDEKAEISAQLEEEKTNTSKQAIEIRNLKERLDAEKKKLTDMLRSGRGVSAEAKRTFNEVIDRANEQAADIIEDAKKKAAEIIADAQKQSEALSGNASSFLELLKGQLEAINQSFNTVNSSASELLGTEFTPAEFNFEAVKPAVKREVPVSEQPAEQPSFSAVEQSFNEEEAPEAPSFDAFDGSFDTEDNGAMEGNIFAEHEEQSGEAPAEADEIAAAIAAAEALAKGEAPAASEPEEEIGGFDDIFSKEQTAESGNAEDIPLMNPEAESNPFDNDMFNLESTSSEDMTGFDFNSDNNGGEVKPLDVSDHSEASYSKDFTADLLAQTMVSSNLGEDTDSDVAAAVRERDAAAAVIPSDAGDISMDEDGNDEPVHIGMSEEDQLMRALREAEAALSDVGSSAQTEEAEEQSADAGDPWAALQEQLASIETSGANIEYDTAQDDEDAPPAADDNNIWNFGMDGDESDSSENKDEDDDMMSSSGFGDFGGF